MLCLLPMWSLVSPWRLSTFGAEFTLISVTTALLALSPIVRPLIYVGIFSAKGTHAVEYAHMIAVLTGTDRLVFTVVASVAQISNRTGIPTNMTDSSVRALNLFVIHIWIV